jgi:hypothetical protein
VGSIPPAGTSSYDGKNPKENEEKEKRARNRDPLRGGSGSQNKSI